MPFQKTWLHLPAPPTSSPGMAAPDPQPEITQPYGPGWRDYCRDPGGRPHVYFSALWDERR